MTHNPRLYTQYSLRRILYIISGRLFPVFRSPVCRRVAVVSVWGSLCRTSLAGVITLIRIAVLAMGLLQYCLNLSVIPPDCGTDCDKGNEAQSGNTPYGYCKRNGDVECSESGEECQKQCCCYYEFPAFQAFGCFFDQDGFIHGGVLSNRRL